MKRKAGADVKTDPDHPAGSNASPRTRQRHSLLGRNHNSSGQHADGEAHTHRRQIP